MTVSLSTHVLDAARGRPAVGVGVGLYQDERLLAAAVTDADGRVSSLGEDLTPGAYRLAFEVGAYFAERPHLWERVVLELRLEEGERHHVPLLLSPFSCTAYRGS